MKKALYPGTFDPITNGHLDIIKRASRVFDHLTVTVAEAYHKKAFFSLDERRRLVEDSTKGLSNVTVGTFSGFVSATTGEIQPP